ncbi:MAG: hydroxyacid dehydrogenase, partial [Candidatus Micrarchaeaceae archaeon]
MFEILVTEPEYFDKDSIKILKSIGKVTTKRMKKDELLTKISNYDILIVRIETKLTKEVLEKAKKLKIIGSATTGLNHIDTDYANKKNIKIINLHGIHTISTSEHTIALMFALVRKIPWAFENMKKNIWKRYLFIGSELNGKTLGIIGLGRIGSTVAKYAKALGMNVIAYDPFVKESSIAKLLPIEKVFKYSDILSLHPMLTKENKGMITFKLLKLMKPTAFLINTSRGEIIDSKALLKTLKLNIISGAALDVFPEEPLLKNNIFAAYARKKNNLIITPHIGASTKEAVHIAGMDLAKKVKTEFNK